MPDWVVPTLLTALGVIVWFLARRMMARQDETNEKLNEIKNYIQSELRQFDVRLSVVETLVLPNKK